MPRRPFGTFTCASALIALGALATSLHAAAPAYTFAPVDVPGSTRTIAHGLNDAGQIVGHYEGTVGGRGHGFIKDGQTFTTLDVPGAASTSAHGINAAGEIVGSYRTGEANWLGFHKAGDTFATVKPPGGVASHPWKISDAGVIVGEFVSDGLHGFTRDSAGYHTVDVPLDDADFTWMVSDVNAAGRMVGAYLTPQSLFRGFEKVGDTYSPVHVPGAFFTLARGIDHAGRIVGTFNAGNGDGRDNHAFIKIGDEYFPLATPTGWTTVEAFDINESGQIVGTYVDGANRQHGFVATPVPEPAACATVAIAAAIATLKRRRRA